MYFNQARLLIIKEGIVSEALKNAGYALTISSQSHSVHAKIMLIANHYFSLSPFPSYLVNLNLRNSCICMRFVF